MRAPVSEVAGTIHVERTHAAMLAEVSGQDHAVGEASVFREEVGEELTGGVIDHGH